MHFHIDIKLEPSTLNETRFYNIQGKKYFGNSVS